MLEQTLPNQACFGFPFTSTVLLIINVQPIFFPPLYSVGNLPCVSDFSSSLRTITASLVSCDALRMCNYNYKRWVYLIWISVNYHQGSKVFKTYCCKFYLFWWSNSLEPRNSEVSISHGQNSDLVQYHCTIDSLTPDHAGETVPKFKGIKVLIPKSFS